MKLPAIAHGLRALFAFLFSAALWIAIFVIGASVCILFGVQMLFGAGWTFIAGGVISAVCAVVLILGVGRNG